MIGSVTRIQDRGFERAPQPPRPPPPQPRHSSARSAHVCPRCRTIGNMRRRARQMGATVYDNTELKHDIDTFVERVWPEVLDDLAGLVRHRSVEDLSQATEGAPWGPGPRAALDEALGIAQRVGLSAHDCDGYLGYADVPGASAQQLATIAHVDVVSEGPGWHTDPFEMTRRDGWLLGRGVIDDKGPAVLSIHAARFFAERIRAGAEPLPYTLRVLLGANEETSMGDVEFYLAHYEQPAFLFTPDAEFPVCCGEKGTYTATFSSAPICGPVAGSIIVEIEGGAATNAIPSLAHAVVRADSAALPAAQNIELAQVDSAPRTAHLARITAHGIGGHASLPAGTRNAIGMLCDYLLKQGLCSPAECRFLKLEAKIHAASDGLALGIAASDECFGPLTCIGGTLHMTSDGRLEQTIDVRYPTSVTAEALTPTLGTLADEHGCTYKVMRSMPPFYVDPRSPEIQTLVRCYNEYTGHNAKPFTIGGGTYARHFAKAASFGPEEPTLAAPAWVGQMHGPDEGASEAQLRLALKIYVYAIAELMRLKL